jgi:hypothetical protein
MAIDFEPKRGDSEEQVLHRIVRLLEHTKNEIEWIKKHMITQAVFDASAKALTDAVTNAINNIPAGNPASTPDTAVAAYIATVDANTAHLNAAENPVPPPPIASK